MEGKTLRELLGMGVREMPTVEILDIRANAKKSLRNAEIIKSPTKNQWFLVGVCKNSSFTSKKLFKEKQVLVLDF